MNDYSEKEPYKYLALGDSYTIGEMVTGEQSFPWQFVNQLRSKGTNVNDPVVIAKTGWTTDELGAAINEANPANDFDIVTLLIGVNNQYRGRDPQEYGIQFEALLRKAIQCAKGDPGQVVVLSIPDWGVTPYAAGRNKEEIARQIDSFNLMNQNISKSAGVRYIDITPSTRQAVDDPGLLAEDELHPSGKEYKKWADQLVSWFADPGSSPGQVVMR